MAFNGKLAILCDFRAAINGRCPRCLARPPPVSKDHLKNGCVGGCLGQGIKKFRKN
jgi:hypothetical protein